MRNKQFLFVYGTLMKQSSHPMAAFVLSNCMYVGKATMKGELYKISWYPGALFNRNSVSVVEGDLYEIQSNLLLENFFSVLDEYEGVGEQFPFPNEYKRELVEVSFEEKVLLSWAYIYNWPLDSSQRIERFV